MEGALHTVEAVASFTLGLIVTPLDKYYVWWLEQWRETPWHLVTEVGLIFLILWVTFVKKSYNPQKRGFGDRAPDDELTDAEIDQMVADWEPEELAPPMPEGGDPVEDQIVIEAVDGPQLTIEGRDEAVLNLASFDFLGLGSDPGIKEVALDTLREYGCGTCGPRGFYGTSMKHIELEEALAKFMKVDEAICYSDSVSCVASAVPAFAKRGDLLVIDDGINHAVMSGALLSRAKIILFEHNNMEDLERALREATTKDARTGANKVQRRFIICEGLYRNFGDLCPLADVLQLKQKYHFRLVLDETLSFGTLGATGRGLTEHAGFSPNDVDVLTASLATTLGSVGGFCAGTREVVDHQRLSGAGYCYSASAPPFLCASAQYALEQMEDQPDLLETLRSNAARAIEGLGVAPGLEIESDEASPLIHMRLAEAALTPDEDQIAILKRIQSECLDSGVFIGLSRYLSTEKRAPPPSLRVHVTAALEQAELDYAVGAIVDATTSVLAPPKGRARGTTRRTARR